MKRATSTLWAIAALAVGFFFFAEPAQAQTPLDTISNGGVDCYQWATNYSGGQYPQTYWVCTATGSNPTSREKLVGSQARNLPAGMKTVLEDVELMIFQNQADFASFTGAAAPDTKYMAWTADNGPGSLSNSRIAAVFATADLYSPNISPTHQIASRDITAHYAVNMMQALGRHYDQLTGNPSQLQETPVHIFPIAVEYDAVWTNEEQSVTAVWGSNLASQYSGQTSWQILGTLYGNTSADIYAFQFARYFGGTWSHLNQFINGYLHETRGFRQQQIFNEVTALPVTGVYKPAAGQDPARVVFCVEYSTIYNQPADTIRNCVHPYGYKAAEIQAGSGVSNLPSAIRSHLTNLNNPVKLFVMRDIFDYETYFGTTVAGGGHIGISYPWGRLDPNGNTIIPVVAFRDTLAGPGGFPGPLVDNYYKGTLVHEVGHVLDDLVYLVNNVAFSQTQDWADIVDDDKALFNGISTCMIALNDTEACSTTDSKYTQHGNDWWNRFLEKMGLYGKTQGDINREMFTYMFQKRASGADTIPFVQYFEGRIWSLSPPSMKNQMDTIWSTGAP